MEEVLGRRCFFGGAERRAAGALEELHGFVAIITFSSLVSMGLGVVLWPPGDCGTAFVYFDVVVCRNHASIYEARVISI